MTGYKTVRAPRATPAKSAGAVWSSYTRQRVGFIVFKQLHLCFFTHFFCWSVHPSVGDIPQPQWLNSRSRAASRDSLSSKSTKNQPMTRTVSRSYSVLSPWTPRHLRDGYEINYSQQSNSHGSKVSNFIGTTRSPPILLNIPKNHSLNYSATHSPTLSINSRARLGHGHYKHTTIKVIGN